MRELKNAKLDAKIRYPQLLNCVKVGKKGIKAHSDKLHFPHVASADRCGVEN